MTAVKEALSKLSEHPFTQIQLSDREKFHTGMLKLTLDRYDKYAYQKIFGQPFVDKLYEGVKDSQKEIKACLEENLVDLVIKKLIKNKKGKSIWEAFAIIESKFKTGIHYSKMKIDNESKNVNQLEKYARNNSNTEYGFVISLFKEAEEIKINIKGVAIKEFIPLTYTDQILKFLSECNFKNYGTSAIPLIKLWRDYLINLKLVVNKFGTLGLNNIEEKNSEKNKIKNDLNNIKLKGIFERYRLNLIKKSIEDELSIDLKDKLIEGAEIWKKPEPEKNYIIIGNTHGNASISFVFKTERKNSYGIQWQAGSVKIFIQFENLKNIEIETDLKKRREDQLKLLVKNIMINKKTDSIEKYRVKEIEKDNLKNQNAKFQSITLIKKEVFEDIKDMPKELENILKILKAKPPVDL